ncbi:hypothetical protein ACFFX0_04640 [Citricoccus parietis]|uniref:Uncharacterized protein n=1 Tax=Citricoccus parietis TaxID=592307 RepID=A0ABV5FV12_9MICC
MRTSHRPPDWSASTVLPVIHVVTVRTSLLSTAGCSCRRVRGPTRSSSTSTADRTPSTRGPGSTRPRCSWPQDMPW